MLSVRTILYSSRTYTTGGRDGCSRSDDGRLDVQLSPPGTPGTGTNPEQLFAACWSACFIGALRHAAHSRRIVFPVDAAVAAEVDLGHGEQGFFLQVRLLASLPGLDPEAAQWMLETARRNCPYSKATRGNIDVTVALA